MPIYFQLTQQALPFNLESIGNHWPQVYINRPEGYPFYHWIQTESGCGEVWIEKQKVILKKDEGLLIAPFTPHTYFSLDHWQTNFATFNGDFAHHFYDVSQVNTFVYAENTDDFNFSDWINIMISDYLNKTLLDTELSTRCYEFLLQFRSLNKQHANLKHPLFIQFILPIINEIETRYSEELTIKILAQEYFISTQYLNRLFQRFLGQSPYQYLIDYRINRAKELLVNEQQLEIQEISWRVGFISVSQFIHIFKEKVAYTPKQFRNLFFAKP